jgi:O-antigen/teichoic acid export membrane protein
MGYSQEFKKGIRWTFLLRVGTRIITFARTAILARLLTPAQFGYFGIASLLLSLLEILTETGINVFLVQEKGNIRTYLNSAWVISIIRGILLALIVIGSGGFIASFFNAQEAYSIILLMSAVPFIRGFINPSIIIYQKELLFHKEVKLRFWLFFVDSVVAITVGFITRSASSFVWGLIVSALVEVFLSYILFPLRPKIQLELAKIKHIIRRGSWVTLTGIFSYFADNGDNIAVGRILGSAPLGVYQVAYKFSTLPISEITNVVNQVVFPVYAKFSEDRVRLKNAFIRVTGLTIIGAILLGGLIFVFARPMVYILMGDQWVQAIPVIQVLAFYGILRTSFGSFSALFLSVGRQDYVAKMTLVRVIGLALAIVPLITTYGMIGAGYAMLASVLMEIPVIVYLTGKVFVSHKNNIQVYKKHGKVL